MSCERCDGYGVIVIKDDPGALPSECGLPSRELEFIEPCPACVERGQCPICGGLIDGDYCIDEEDCGWVSEFRKG